MSDSDVWSKQIGRENVCSALPLNAGRQFGRAIHAPLYRCRRRPRMRCAALTGRGYGHLAIQDGSMASQEYLRVHFGDVPEAERQHLHRHLEAYCGLDTMGMIWIVEGLERMRR